MVRNALLKQLYSVQFLRQKLLTVMNRGASGFMDPVFLAMRDPRYLEDSMVFLRKELERLQRISSRLAFDYVVILIPDVHQIDARRLAGKARALGLNPQELEADGITRAISRALDDLQIPYADLGPCLSEASVGELCYTRDTHFTAAGHARAARCILKSGLLAPFITAVRSVEASVGNAI